MRRLIPLVALIICTAPARADDALDLQPTRIALFNSGVGYFETVADVSGDATAELTFRTQQINDILKSLIVQDFDGGQVGVVRYPSQDPIEKTLRSFGVDITGDPTLAELLDQLRGEPVEIDAPRKLQGIILGVESQQVRVDNILVELDLLNLLTDGGIEQLKLAEVRGIKLTNEKVAKELRQALATLARAHDAEKKTVRVNFTGDGERKVRVAYLLETPIWKTTYRLALSDKEDPFLQGWAIVENATEADWNDVRLSLVAGRPISFVMDLYTPIYVPRPEEALELYASIRPPEYEGGMPAIKDLPPPMAAGQRLRGAARRGALSARAETEERMGGNLFDSGSRLELDDAGVQAMAAAEETGELFEYRIETPVSIPRQQSAMLPVVNERVQGEKLSIYNQATHRKHPLNGLELKNETDLHLMQGPITVFDDGVYAGDAKLPDLKPGEKRLVAYALDLGAEVIVDQKPTPDEIVNLRIAKGVLIHTHRYVNQREYTLKNKANKPKTVLVEHPYSSEWELVSPRDAYERTQDLLRFKVAVPAQKTEKLTVELQRTADQRLALFDASVDVLRFYLRTRVITPEMERVLERLISLRQELADAQRQVQRIERDLNEALEDQERIRKNLRTLDRNTDAYQRQLRKFDEVETQIEQLRAQRDQAQQTENQRRAAVEQYIMSLEIG